MKRYSRGTLLGLALLLPGCIVQSLHPFYTDDLRCDPPKSILRKWTFIEQYGDNLREKKIAPWTFEEDRVLTVDENGRTSPIEAAYFKVGDLLYVDLVAGDPPETKGTDAINGYWFFHVVPVHSVAQVRQEEGRLALVPLNAEWVSNALEKGELDLPHTQIGTLKEKHVAFTATPEQWVVFLKKQGANPDVFSTKHSLVFERSEPF